MAIKKSSLVVEVYASNEPNLILAYADDIDVVEERPRSGFEL